MPGSVSDVTAIMFGQSLFQVFGEPDISFPGSLYAFQTVYVMEFHGLPGRSSTELSESGYVALRRDRLRSCNELQTKPGGSDWSRTSDLIHVKDAL